MRKEVSPTRSLLRTCLTTATIFMVTGLTTVPAAAQAPTALKGDLVIGKAGEFGHQGNMAMLFGNGPGTFDTNVIGLSGFTGFEVAVGDVNNDGKDDVVVVAATGQVQVALGSFADGLQNSDLTPQGAFVEGSGNCCERTRVVQLTDVNGDGNLDIAVTMWAKLAVRLGNGNGTFGDAILSNMANFDSRSLALGDVTGDGIEDAVVGNASGNWSLWVHRGLGNGSFASPVHVPNSDLAVPNLALRDADDDGDLDIYSGSFESKFKIFLNNGVGGFAETNSGAGSGTLVITEDLNGDGKVDVVTGAGSTLDVTLSNGTVASYPISNNARHGTVGDFNADGIADIAVVAVDIFAGPAHDGELWILLGSGGGAFAAPYRVPTYRNNYTIVAGDFDAPSDTTPPVITPTVTGTESNGWYTSDVTVSWAVADAESAISSSSGCTAQTVTTDTTGTTYTCSATSLGGTSSQSVTIKRDTTGPAIASASANPSMIWPPNNKMVAVTVSVSATDAGSGLAGCSITGVNSNEGGSAHEPDVALTGALTMNVRAERHGGGSGRVYTAYISCADAAGNTSTSTATVTVPHDQGKR